MTGDHDTAVSVAVEHDGVRVLGVSGDLDLASAPDLRGTVAGSDDAGDVGVIDLTGCGFVDSSGVRAIVHVAAAWQQRGCAVVVASPPRSSCRQVLELLGVDQVAVLAASRADALAVARRLRDDPGRGRSDGTLAS